MNAALAAAVSLTLAPERGGAWAQEETPTGPPAAAIDLMTKEGVELARGQWRYSDTRIIEVEFRGKKTYDYTPHANQVARPDFDDSAWQALEPTALRQARAAGKLCFSWYRITVTVPERVGTFDPTGSTLVFDTTVDDYGEIWVNGKLDFRVGQKGGNVAAGFNAPNRLVLGRGVKPGQQFTLAIFAINGPVSRSPENLLFLRQARLEFYPVP